jgi:hypothetical protein
MKIFTLLGYSNYDLKFYVFPEIELAIFGPGKNSKLCAPLYPLTLHINNKELNWIELNWAIILAYLYEEVIT